MNFRRPNGLPYVCTIKDARCNIFPNVKVILEMLDLCTKFAEAMSFDVEKVQTSPARAYSGGISFAQFLTSQGLDLETSHALVHLCLEKRCQPSDLTLDELQKINFPCDCSHDLLQDKSNTFDGFFHCDQLKKILKWW